VTRIINMWASPRNVSTAMMYAWAQRSDTTVWDEPMYGNFLAVTLLDHPMAKEILASVPYDAYDIADQMLRGDWDTPLVFYKNMAHHLIGFDIAMVDDMENFILTRDPIDMLPSLYRGLDRVPTASDAAYSAQVDILDRIIASGRDPIVVDSRSVLDDPQGTLTALCDRLSVPFDTAMLSWPAGPKEYDGVWGPHWYKRLHASTGFEPYTAADSPLPEELKAVYEECAPLYDRLTQYAIT
jgi:hypothetical protein